MSQNLPQFPPLPRNRLQLFCLLVGQLGENNPEPLPGPAALCQLTLATTSRLTWDSAPHLRARGATRAGRRIRGPIPRRARRNACRLADVEPSSRRPSCAAILISACRERASWHGVGVRRPLPLSRLPFVTKWRLSPKTTSLPITPRRCRTARGRLKCRPAGPRSEERSRATRARSDACRPATSSRDQARFSAGTRLDQLAGMRRISDNCGSSVSKGRFAPQRLQLRRPGHASPWRCPGRTEDRTVRGRLATQAPLADRLGHVGQRTARQQVRVPVVRQHEILHLCYL